MQPFNKYQNGKIYKVWSLETDEIYVGSTVDLLHKRMYKHRNDAKHGRTKMKIHLEMQRLGIDVFTIELIENYPCVDCNELHMREGFWIRELKPTLNTLIAGRTRKEWEDDNKEVRLVKNKERWLNNRDNYLAKKKEYYENNKETILQKHKKYAMEHVEEKHMYHKNYREINAEKLKEQKKQYYNANREQVLEQKKQYREKNKDKIQAHKSESHVCTVCGSTYTNCHKTRHERTQKHIQALAKHTE